MYQKGKTKLVQVSKRQNQKPTQPNRYRNTIQTPKFHAKLNQSNAVFPEKHKPDMRALPSRRPW
ncbi:hypothetical protein SCA6_004040 [Theobroma cacao]